MTRLTRRWIRHAPVGTVMGISDLVRSHSASERIVCLGEALVDLICPDPVTSAAEARRYEAHPGGALANVAVAAARAGAPAALAGGIGTDPFGRLLMDRIRAEGVETSRLKELEALETPYAFVTLDLDREPSYRIHGAGIEAGVGAWEGEEDGLLEHCSALVVGSNTLVDPRSSGVTRKAVRLAGERGIPACFDVNLRAHRWEDLARARATCRELAAGCTLVKCNRAEAAWMTEGKGASDEELAEALVGLGAGRGAGSGGYGVLTRGGDGALMAGRARASASAPEIAKPYPLGSGDAFMGTLCAGLVAGAWDPESASESLRGAAIAGAEAARSPSALGGCDR